VCDNAAGEVCPLYNVAPRKGGAGRSNPARAHWGYPDPSAAEGTDAEKLAAFKHTLHAMRRRIELLINLPPEKLEASSLQASAKALASA
jgi:arsenate reductase (thioredoxin)